jgi:hypothetical protein
MSGIDDATSNSGNPMNMSDLAGALAGRISDPIAAAVIGSFLARRSDDARETESDSSERELERARRTVRKLQEALSSADSMALYVATTFGACPACWGLNTFCPRCRGQGGPGSSNLDADGLLRWVEPALRRLGLEVVADTNVGREPVTERKE